MTLNTELVHWIKNTFSDYTVAVVIWMFGFLPEIQGIWASGAGGGDRWAAAGEEAGRGHGGDVSQESPGNEGTQFFLEFLNNIVNVQ